MIYLDRSIVSNASSEIPLNVTKTKNYIGISNWNDGLLKFYLNFNRALNSTSVSLNINFM